MKKSKYKQRQNYLAFTRRALALSGLGLLISGSVVGLYMSLVHKGNVLSGVNSAAQPYRVLQVFSSEQESIAASSSAEQAAIEHEQADHFASITTNGIDYNVQQMHDWAQMVINSLSLDTTRVLRAGILTGIGW